jgi:hypothetical protein
MRDFLEDTCNPTYDNGHRTEVPVYYLKSCMGHEKEQDCFDEASRNDIRINKDEIAS